MGRCNIEYNGKWACFSSVVDAFITKFMSREDYDEWRLTEYDRNGYRPLEECNIKSFDDVSLSIYLNRSHDEALECILESGLSKEESEQILYDIETKYYVPILKDNGKFECPNCHKEIKKGQIECDDESCCLEFIWRD